MSKLNDKSRDLEKKFKLLRDKKNALVGQRAQLDRQIAMIDREQTLLQGENRAVQALLKEETPEGDEAPKEKPGKHGAPKK